MANIENIQATIHQIALELRNLDEIVSSTRFAISYEKASKARQSEAIDILNKRDVKALRRWLDEESGLDSKSVIELRRMARRLGLNSVGMSKAVLIYYIEEAQRAARQDSTSSHEDEETNSESGN